MCAATPDTKGLKRVCSACGIRFYDLNKRPIVCPTCGTSFTGEIKVKNRRARIIADDQVSEGQRSAGELEDELEDLGEEAQVVSLEDLEEGQDDDDAEDLVIDPDLDIDEDLEALADDEDLEDLEPDADLIEEEDEA